MPERWEQGKGWWKRLQRIIDLVDTPARYGSTGQVLLLDASARKLEWGTPGAYFDDSIILMQSGGWTLYDVDDAGLTAALAAAESGDVVWVPRHTFTSAITVPAGVMLYGVNPTLSGATAKLSAGASVEGWTLTYSTNSSSAVRCVYADIDEGERVWIRRCVISCVNTGSGQTDGIVIEGMGRAYVHDCEITATGTNSSAIHCNTDLTASGAAVIGMDKRDDSEVAADTWITESGSGPDAEDNSQLQMWVYPSAQDAAFSYFVMRYTGRAFAYRDWGEPPSTPVSVQVRCTYDYDTGGYHGWPGPNLLEYYNEISGTWVTTDQYLIDKALVNIGGTVGFGFILARIKRTDYRPAQVCKFVGDAMVSRSSTERETSISLQWSQANVGIYVEDTVLSSGQYDIYAESGLVEVAGCAYNPSSVAGVVSPVAGDRAVWDVEDQPEWHARDIADGEAVYHWTAAQLAAELPPVTLAGTYDYITISGQAITRHQIDLATDVVIASEARGDILTRGAALWQRLGLGGIAGSVITRDATDTLWSTFALAGTAGQTYTFPAVSASIPGGTGVANQVTYWNGTNAQTGAATFTYNPAVSPNTLITAANAAHVPLVIRLAAAHTANAVEVQSSGGGVLSSVNKDGHLGIGIAASSVFDIKVANNVDIRGILYIGNELVFNDNGSVSDPNYTWAGDGDTGFYHPAEGEIAVTNKASESMRITSAGTLFRDKVMFTQTDGNEAIDSLNDGYLDYLATTAHRFNTPLRSTTASYRRYYHLPVAAFNPGASGATFVPPSANLVGGYRLDAAGEVLYFDSDIHADWDAASDIDVEVYFAVNVDNTGGGGGDTVDLKLISYYNAVGDVACKTQTVEVATVVGASAQYKVFKAEFAINYDEVDNVVEVGDILGFILNLETDTSEVDDVVILHASLYYHTTHVGIESGDV